MSKKIGVILWALGLALANLLLFVLEKGMTATFWITVGFVWTAFVSDLAFQLLIVRKTQTPDDSFLHMPAFLVMTLYELAQIPVCVIFALGSSVIPGKVALLVQGVLLIAAWAISLLSLVGNDHIKKVNSRQKDHHTEL